jgi:hypothetical protein
MIMDSCTDVFYDLLLGIAENPEFCQDLAKLDSLPMVNSQSSRMVGQLHYYLNATVMKPM